MKEQKQTTYGDLKQRKQEMRDEGIVATHMEEYLQVLQAIKDAELELLWSITPNESYGELSRAKKCRKAALVSFAIAGIAAVLLLFGLFGCQTFKGATGDSAWMLQKLSDNIMVQEK